MTWAQATPLLANSKSQHLGLQWCTCKPWDPELLQHARANWGLPFSSKSLLCSAGIFQYSITPNLVFYFHLLFFYSSSHTSLTPICPQALTFYSIPSQSRTLGSQAGHQSGTMPFWHHAFLAPLWLHCPGYWDGYHAPSPCPITVRAGGGRLLRPGLSGLLSPQC